MTVVGTKKMAVYDDVADNKIAIYDKGIEPKAVLGQRMDFDHAARTAAVHASQRRHPDSEDRFSRADQGGDRSLF